MISNVWLSDMLAPAFVRFALFTGKSNVACGEVLESKMMQHAKLSSPASLAAARKETGNALVQLEASPSDAHKVYSSLTGIYNVLAEHPQAPLAVDSALATQKSVHLLRELVAVHLRQEEVQWALGRVISLAAQASLRFQCLAGQIQLWNELFDMRSAHPQSIRVLEASLRASEALFRSNEFNVAKLQPRLLLDDLLGVMNRFLRVQTPRRRAHGLVVLALRVMVALYASPRPTGLLLFNGESRSEGERWAREIARHMLESFAVCSRDVGSIRTWLDMALLLHRQYPTQALEGLFSPAPSKAWWFVSVVERWQSQADVMSALLATLTRTFALPHQTIGDEKRVALAERLIREQSLLHVVCGVLDHYHHVACRDLSLTCSQRSSSELVRLEAIRVVRQWSERPTLVPACEASSSVKTVLLPVLIDLLDLDATQPASSTPSKRLVVLLEVLLVLRHLSSSRGLHGVLAGSAKLQTTLKWLRSGTRPASCSTDEGAQRDGELAALVAREARNLLALLAPGPNAAPRSAAIVAARAAAPPRRQLKPAHAKPETLRAYHGR
jgi:hypothetical protein